MKNNRKGLRVNAEGQIEQIEAAIPESSSVEVDSNMEVPKQAPSEKVLFRAQNRLLMKYLLPLAPMLNGLYRKPKGLFTGINKVLNHNFKNAITGVHPKFVFNFSQLILSIGNLPVPPGLSVSSPENASIVLRWTDDSGIGLARGDDHLFIAVYGKKSKIWYFKRGVASRKDCVASIEVSRFHDQVVEVFIGFASEDLRRTSNSVYMGMIRIADYVI